MATHDAWVDRELNGTYHLKIEIDGARVDMIYTPDPGSPEFAVLNKAIGSFVKVEIDGRRVVSIVT